MRVWLILALAAAPLLRAGTIQGMVLEFGSGLPLARARVYLEAVDATGVKRLASLYTQRGGQFSFGNQPDGLYLVSAERESYAVASYGQRRPEGWGTPFAVTAESSQFVELKLHKLGVITGTVRDENGVGQPGVRVRAYARRLPLRSVAAAMSDDRGVYRLHGLAPGKYWVRTASHSFAETGEALVPTFAPETPASGAARIYEARLDGETAFADVRPLAGRLGAVRGAIGACDSTAPVDVVLSTEEGHRHATSACGGAFEFDNVADGPKELTLVTTAGACLGYAQDLTTAPAALLVQLQPCPTVRFERKPEGPGVMQVRRRDAAGEGAWREVKGAGPVELPPGSWEVALRAPSTHYLADVRQRMNIRSRGHGPDWFQFNAYAGQGQVVTLTLGEAPASIAGVVRQAGQGIAAAPVFLWPVTDAARRSLGGMRQMRADRQGRFRFEGMPPGEYRLLATYDFTDPDEDAMQQPAARAVTTAAGQAALVDLELFESR